MEQDIQASNLPPGMIKPADRHQLVEERLSRLGLLAEAGTTDLLPEEFLPTDEQLRADAESVIPGYPVQRGEGTTNNANPTNRAKPGSAAVTSKITPRRQRFRGWDWRTRAWGVKHGAWGVKRPTVHGPRPTDRSRRG